MNLDFDPFVITKEHPKHADQVNLIHIQGLGRILCLNCLSTQATSNLSNIDEELFQQYVRNLFEILDQRSQCKDVRAIVLPILNVITSRRPMVARNEYDYHSILRMMKQVMDSTDFDPGELTLVAKIFTQVSIVKLKALPLLTRWRVIDQMIKSAKSKMSIQPIGNIENYPANTFKLLKSLSILIRDCLERFDDYSIDQATDIIFPLSSSDESLLHNRKFYVDSQWSCLHVIKELILDKSWTYLSNLEDKIDDIDVRDFAIELFKTLKTYLKTSIRLDSKFFYELDEYDCIFTCSKLIFNNPYKLFRESIRSFLKFYIEYHIKLSFDYEDQGFQSFISSDGMVELNFSNVRAQLTQAQTTQAQNKKVIFYIIANCIAMKLKSNYFNYDKIRCIVTSLDLKKMDFYESNTLMKALNYLLSRLNLNSTQPNIIIFFTSLWSSMLTRRENNKFYEQFCFDSTVFYWLCEHPVFASIVDGTCLHKILSRTAFVENLQKLIYHPIYGQKMIDYLKNDQDAIDTIERLINTTKNNPKYNTENLEVLHRKLGSLLICVVHGNILDYGLNINSSISKKKALNSLNMLILLIKGIEKFDLPIEQETINDMFSFMEKLFYDKPDGWEETIMMLNELISSLIQTRNPSLMTILKALDFHALGYLLYHVQRSSLEDNLVRSIAHLLSCYDELDYPLKYRLVDSMFIKSVKLTKWMLSQDDNLNNLAIQLLPSVINRERRKSIKICILCGLIHMIFNKRKFARCYNYSKLYSSILNMNEFKYNPLREYLSNVSGVDIEPEAPPSPPYSFTSAESNPFEDDQMEVRHIVDQLGGGMLFDNDYRIPNNLFVTQGVNDQLSRADIESWENNAMGGMSDHERDN